jgi:hypothetical protein
MSAQDPSEAELRRRLLAELSRGADAELAGLMAELDPDVQPPADVDALILSELAVAHGTAEEPPAEVDRAVLAAARAELAGASPVKAQVETPAGAALEERRTGAPRLAAPAPASAEREERPPAKVIPLRPRLAARYVAVAVASAAAAAVLVALVMGRGQRPTPPSIPGGPAEAARWQAVVELMRAACAQGCGEEAVRIVMAAAPDEAVAPLPFQAWSPDGQPIGTAPPLAPLVPTALTHDPQDTLSADDAERFARGVIGVAERLRAGAPDRMVRETEAMLLSARGRCPAEGRCQGYLSLYLGHLALGAGRKVDALRFAGDAASSPSADVRARARDLQAAASR